MKKPRILLLAILLIGFCFFASLLAVAVQAQALPRLLNLLPEGKTENQTSLVFDYQIIDSDTAGDCKMVGDIDGDGFPDLVIGGFNYEKLNWYRYPDWKKTVIATPNIEFTTDGALGDVDGDGDLDIIVPDGNLGNNLVWFENPRPDADPFVGEQWTRHEIGALDDYGKDVELADFDSDGRLDVAARNTTTAFIFFQTGANNWEKIPLTASQAGEEGLGSGDIDGDRHIDLVLRGIWLRNPGGANARAAGSWQEYAIGQADNAFKALVVDLNKDGQNDVLFTSSEGTAPVEWWSPQAGGPTAGWEKHTIIASLERAHTLQAADMDLDGDLDVVVGQMHTSQGKELLIMENSDGNATAWKRTQVGNIGIHNGVVADIGNDGDFDIYGANWAGNPPVGVWVNHLELAENWTYYLVSIHHAQTFGLAFGDLNQDGKKDIVSGPFWYRNPGGDLLGNWQQYSFPEKMHAFLVVNVDCDRQADVIAQSYENETALYWLEAADSTGQSWNAVRIGAVDPTTHALGSQGYRSAQLKAGGKPEILISSGKGIYYFSIPDQPEAGNWPRVHISANPSDEGFATGDIDRDGDMDIAATTGETRRVEWYANPGDGTENWQAFEVGLFTGAVYPDRVELADLNGDDRLDIIVAEENGEPQGAETDWWEQPADPRAGRWVMHLITSQGTTNSMDAADMNKDGYTDLVLAEHRGKKELTVWLNDGSGQFSRQFVSSGRESHLGAQTVDLDGDGDLDIVSIAWDEFQRLHLWRNNSAKGGTP